MTVVRSPEPFHIAPMRGEDIEAVMEIERLSFRAPWSRQIFLEELNREFARVDVVHDERSDAIVAYGNYWLVADELHILNIASHPEHRRVGHAKRLLAHMIDAARALPARMLSLEVRRSNAAAQQLYRKFAFRPVGVRPRYYADDQEDAIVMLLELS